ncbi:hypothetical protein [Soonwooa purpurea]
MKKSKLNSVIFIFIMMIVSVISCQTEVNNNEEEVAIDDTVFEVFKTQIVAKEMNGAKNGQTYIANFQGETLECRSFEDNKIAFVIPSDAVLGNSSLEVAELNKKINLNIKDVLLNDTPENVVKTFWTSVDNYTSTLDNSDETSLLKDNLNNVKNVFEKATAEEKKTMATFFSANKDLYDEILKNSPQKSMMLGQDDNLIANENFLMFKTSMYYLATCGVVLWVAKDPFIVSAALVGIYINFKNAKKYGGAFIDTRMLILDSSIQDKSTIDFITGDTKVLNYSFERRSVINGDKGNAFGNFSDFFLKFAEFEGYFEKINSVATWLNQKIPFCNFSMVTNVLIPQQVNSSNVLVNDTTFARAKFSVSNNEVEIEKVNFNSNGKINVQLKLKNQTATQPVVTTLTANYKDDYNEKSKSFNIKVLPKSFITGNWKLLQIVDEDVPADEWEVDEPTGCPGQREDYFYSGIAVFTDTTMKFNISEKYRYYRYDAQCNVVEYKEPTGWQVITANHNNIIESNNLKLTDGKGNNNDGYNWNFNNGIVKILDPNKISLTYSYHDGYELVEMMYVFARQ